MFLRNNMTKKKASYNILRRGHPPQVARRTRKEKEKEIMEYPEEFGIVELIEWFFGAIWRSWLAAKFPPKG